MPRKLITYTCVLALVALSCSKAPSGPQKYAIDVDQKSSARDKFQFAAFYPGSLRVSPGDSIKFRNRSTEAPHTVTFGVLADRKDQPPVLTDKGPNPAVFGPCATSKDPNDKMTKCPSMQLHAYDGKGYWNSGLLQPKPAPKSAGAKSVTIRLAKNIPDGSYAFACLLHPFMNGVITVVADEGDRSTKADVHKGAREAEAQARRGAAALKAPALERTASGVTAFAGWGDRVVSVNRFSPETIEVKAGDKVTWKAGNPYEPHTVTFESKFKSPEDPGALDPAGPSSGDDYTGGLASSGIFGAKGTPFQGSYTLRFPNAGDYKFTCVLHPGMGGTVKVS
jgi:plastocyanin